MAVAADKSNESNDPARALRRMRRLAGGLLLLMAVLFVGAGLWRDRWPQLDYLRAFAEAAMVGAVADWFAVVALFRRPFGLPIPHTAIIPHNKDRIGQALGRFICDNFLAPQAVAAKLDGLDLAGRAADWLGRPGNAGAVSRRLALALPALLDALDDDHVRRLLLAALRRGIAAADAAPLAARALSAVVAQGHHVDLFDRLLDGAEEALLRNEQAVRDKVADRSWRWMPRWVDDRLADKVLAGMVETLTDLRHPDHPWRAEFREATGVLIQRLADDPEFRARGEAVKAELLASPAAAEFLDTAWEGIKGHLRNGLPGDQAVLTKSIEQALVGLGRRLAVDARLRATVNRWARRAVDRLVVPHRGEIGAFIAGQVERWDARTLADKLETQVGRDLQYIRVNGTIVGGLVGLAIHAVSALLG